MEDIDSDLVVNIPDTPDRLAARDINGGKVVRKESNSSGSGRLRNFDLKREESSNHPKERSRMETENGCSRRLHIHPLKPPGDGEEIGCRNHPSNRSLLFRKPVDRNSKDEARNLLGGHHMNKGKAISDAKFEAKEIREGQMANNCSSPLHFEPNGSKTYNNALKGKEKVNENAYRQSDSATNNGKGIDLSYDSQHEMEKQMSKSHHSVISPRVMGRKRLVRNGCISPHNIATRAQQLSEHNQISIKAKDVDQNQTTNEASKGPFSVDISEIVAEDRFKGKGGLTHPPTSNECDAKIIDLSSSIPRSRSKEGHGIGGASQDLVGCSLGLGGWRSTHNRARNIDRLSDDNASSHLAKRQRSGLASRNSDEIVDLESSGRSSSSSSSRIRIHQHHDMLAPIVEIDALPPEMKHSDSQDISHMSTDESDARTRQVEADEMLARELQDQLYSEATIFGGLEIDENIAWSLQQEEDVLRAPSRRSHHVSHPRTVSRTQSNRHPLLRSLQNPSNRRVTQARVPARRMSQLRSRIFGRSPAAASRPRNFQFPLDMDLDMRLDILEALEATVGDLSDTGTTSHILQAQRDFNENDYEMLLALDDNNHQHGGASTNQINSLPQSTVQTDNFDESCAICLETPTVGETIRHLPCLHKFHKDCIDPWLSRRTSCPVCKSSIT